MTVYLCSDIHGDKMGYKYVIDQIENPKEEDIIIVCGDASLEYGNYTMGSCRKVMSKFPGTWLIMRGNHDNTYWKNHTVETKDGLVPQDGWDFSDKFFEITLYQKKYPNIHYIDDSGGIYDVDGHCIIFYPGAYSVDKGYRIAYNLPYEYNEQLTYLQFEHLNKLTVENSNNIEFVISHTAPMFAEPLIEYLFMASIDQSTVDKTTEKWLDIYYKHLLDGNSFKHWFFGHYHDDKELSDTFTIVNNKIVRLEDYV